MSKAKIDDVQLGVACVVGRDPLRCAQPIRRHTVASHHTCLFEHFIPPAPKVDIPSFRGDRFEHRS